MIDTASLFGILLALHLTLRVPTRNWTFFDTEGRVAIDRLDQAYGYELVHEGFVVLAPDSINCGERNIEAIRRRAMPSPDAAATFVSIHAATSLDEPVLRNMSEFWHYDFSEILGGDHGGRWAF